MKHIIISLALLMVGFESYCQMGYQNGLIVTQTDDTIYCLVPIASSFGKKVSIKRSADGNPETILLSSIKYLATATNAYENVAFKKNEKEFHKLMWLEIEGRINLYLELVINYGSTSSIPGGTITKHTDPTKTYVIKKADTTYLIEKKDFIESVIPLISEIPELIKKVESGIYKYENIETLIREYNHLIEKN